MIKINNLSKTFIDGKSSVIALDDISLEVKSGEIISIIGKTGSGKSTLLNIILGILSPTSGEINIDNNIYINKKTKKKDLRKIPKIILSSFQYPTHQLFNITVREEILLELKDEEKMFKIMEQINLSKDLLDKSPFDLSSGQKRKVIIASLLIRDPKVLLFDESTAFLDPKSRVDFIRLLIKINKELKTTIIFISHNIVDVERLNGKTYLLDKGKIIMSGKAKEVISFYGATNE